MFWPITSNQNIMKFSSLLLALIIFALLTHGSLFADYPKQNAEPPSLNCPGDLFISKQESVCGATVDFNILETSGTPGTVVSYSHEPGSLFPMGETLVVVTATNSYGSTQCSFTVFVYLEVDVLLDAQGEVVLTSQDILNASGNCGYQSATVDNALYDCTSQTVQSQITHSHGGGFNPNAGEFWYPQWRFGDQVYRYDRDHNFLGILNTGQQQMMQLWMDSYSTTEYFTANWDENTITKRTVNSTQALWSYDMGGRASAVTADRENVYALRWGANSIAVLDRDTGILKSSIPIPGFTLSYGALALIENSFYIGGRALNWTDLPSTHSYIHVVDMQGNYIKSIPAGTNVFNMAFDGNTIWVSPNSNQIFGTRITESGESWVTDSSGNQFLLPYRVSVLDVTPPEILDCPQTLFRATDPGLCTAEINDIVPAFSDNCSATATYSITGATTASGADDASGTLFNLGTSTVIYTLLDSSGNISLCEFDVVVDEINTQTYVTVSDPARQYSDPVLFEAGITPGVCSGANTPAATAVNFYVGTQLIGSASLSEEGGALKGSLNAPLLEFPAFPSNGQLAPGVKEVRAVFTGVGALYTVPDATTPLTILTEDADITYTGPLAQATSPDSPDETIVILRAHVQDISSSGTDPDTDPGDIRNAKVRFLDRNGGVISGWLNIELLDLLDPTTGMATYTWPVEITSQKENFTIGMEIGNGYYYRNDHADDFILTVYKPLNDEVDGRGTFLSTSSRGIYGAADGSLIEFDFKYKYNKKGNKLKGDIQINYSRLEEDGSLHDYEIESKEIVSLGIDNSDPQMQYATLHVAPTLSDKTDPSNALNFSGPLSLVVSLMDLGEPGAEDLVAFTLYDNNQLLYSSNWNGFETGLRPLVDGDVEISTDFSHATKHGDSESPLLELSEAVFASSVDLGDPEEESIVLWPVPAPETIQLMIPGRFAGEIEVEVYDINSRLILKDRYRPGRPYRFGDQLQSGMYFMRVSWGTTTRILQFVKQ